MSPDNLTREKITTIAERSLQLSGAAGVYPTPLHEVGAVAAQINEIVDISDVPADLAAHKPRRLARLLGLIGFKSRTVFLDRSMSSARQHWATGHEVGHGILPWHEAVAQFDDDARLFRDTREELEREANLAAAYLIFQGNRFVERATDYRLSITTPLALAEDVGASLHATIRYYVESHPEPVALLIAGIYPRVEGLPIWCSVQSAAFLERFGPISASITNGLPLSGDKLPTGLQDAIRTSRALGAGEQSSQVMLCDRNGEWVKMLAEAFSNGHNQFVMFTPKRLARLGTRVRVA